MFAPRWRKIFADLWNSKLRSLLVLATIAIGVFSVGLSVSVYYLLLEDFSHAYTAVNWNHAVIYGGPFDAEMVERVGRVPGVAVAEGRSSTSVRVRDARGEWRDLNLTAIPDFQAQRLNLIRSEQGEWPPRDHQVAIERSSLPLLGAGVGSELEIRLIDDTLRRIPLTGVVYDSSGPSPISTRGYITMDTLTWLHASRSFDRIFIQVSENTTDKAHIQAVADRVADQIRDSGLQVYMVFVPQPGIIPGADQVLGVAAVLAVLGILTVFLGGFLIFNTFNALLGQQVNQIGVMKAIGARTTDIVGMYLVLVLIFGLLSLIPAIPGAIYMAHQSEDLLMTQFNFEGLGMRPVPLAVILQVIVGLTIPVLAGVIPILAGARITVHQAVSSYGVSGGRFGRSLIDRLVETLRFLPRPQLISLRNLFRRKARLLLTLSTLVLAGAIFISVFTVQATLNSFVEDFIKMVLADVTVALDQPYPEKEVLPLVRAIPGVGDVEGWVSTSADLLGSGKEAIDTVSIFGPPADSRLLDPKLLRGRWILPEDQNALVVSTGFYKHFPNLQIGDRVRLEVFDRETEWQVVGVIQWASSDQLASYTSAAYLSRVLGIPGRTYELRITGDGSPQAETRALAGRVEQTLTDHGYGIGTVQTQDEIMQANTASLGQVIVFFMFMAIIIAVVGGIGLAGTMSMNVLERTREIGVMRAIGASSLSITMIVIGEGMLIGFASWLLGVLIALPMSQAMYTLLSQALFKVTTPVVFEPTGYLIWLALSLVLAAFASLMPALNATRLTVREVLAYE